MEGVFTDELKEVFIEAKSLFRLTEAGSEYPSFNWRESLHRRVAKYEAPFIDEFKQAGSQKSRRLKSFKRHFSHI